jgi:hypothetical protein
MWIGLLKKHGRIAEAEAEMQALLARAEKHYGESSPELADALLELASLHLHSKRNAEAIAVADRVLRISDHPELHAKAASAAKWLTALALADTDPARARDLARERRAFLLDHTTTDPKADLKDVDAFLTKLAERGHR